MSDSPAQPPSMPPMATPPSAPPLISTPPVVPAPSNKPAPAPAKTLRKLFLTLFLRGRSARGLQKKGVPKSAGSKLAMALVFYALFGFFAFFFFGQPLLALSIYLHGMTLVFLGMFVAASAGEVLFNKEEPDILLHRPVTPRQLLWAKISVMIQVALYLAGAFNLVGLFVGVAAPDSGWMFPLAHLLSTTLEALFCAGGVVMVYQLCLRWFGRERLDGLMTTTQVIVSITFVVGGQVIPRMMNRFHDQIGAWLSLWWIKLLPPAWFAGLDDALAGTGAMVSWMLALIGVLITAVVVWLAFGKLAQDYGRGLQNIAVVSSEKPRRARRRWIDTLVKLPPLSWWLRNSVSRASFLLTAAYLMRDRDVKLRVYPGLAPMLVMPFVLLLQGANGGAANFGLAFTGAYLGLIPLMALDMVRYSQQWQAADLFRLAPISGPAPLSHGMRRAILVLLALPMLLLFAVIGWVMVHDVAALMLFVPGVLALPVYSLIPCLGGKGVPFSEPTEEGKPAKRNLNMMLVMILSFILSGIAVWAWSTGWFKGLLLGEAVVVACAYVILQKMVSNARWPSME